jgi:hypothetical protein
MSELSEPGRWYVAELIEELAIEGDPCNPVHSQTRVIFADSPEDAYEKALSLIMENEISYRTQDQRCVHTRFWGLRELNLVDEDPELALRSALKDEPSHEGKLSLTPEQRLAMTLSVKPGALPN